MATVSENLLTLNEAKSAIKTAIESKGQDLTGVPFTQYAEKINAISVGGGENKLAKVIDGTATEITAQDLAGATKIRKSAFRLSDITRIEIPDGVTLLDDYAFGYCESLTEAVIPDGVTSINGFAFYYCRKLSSINIPSSVVSISGYAFDYCEGLSGVYISDIDAWCNISFDGYNSNPLAYAKNLYLNNELVTEVIIPSALTKIGTYAFVGCKSLVRVELHDNITSIGGDAFADCSSLSSINIPYGILNIYSRAFYDCSNLQNINIPSSVVELSSYVFHGCNSFTNIELPASIKLIGTRAFMYCKNLVSITMPPLVSSIQTYTLAYCEKLKRVDFSRHESVPSLTNTNAFLSTPSDLQIKVPANLIDSWKSATNWSALADKIVTEFTN